MKWPLWVVLTGCTAAGPLTLVPAVSLPEGRFGRKGEVVLQCSPQDAEVLLDKVPQGLCSDFDGSRKGLKVGRGGRQIVVRKQGYSQWQTWLEASETQVTFSVTLVSTGESGP